MAVQRLGLNLSEKKVLLSGYLKMWELTLNNQSNVRTIFLIVVALVGHFVNRAHLEVLKSEELED